MASKYEMGVINAMMEVESTFQESVCEAYGVDDEEDLPKEIQEIDVVKFAQLSSSNISTVVTTVLDKHLPAGGKGKIPTIIEGLVAAIESAKEKNSAIWPAMTAMDGKLLSGAGAGGDKHMQFEDNTEEKEAAKKFMTGKYDFKVMRKLTAIENKFLDALCGYYGKDDEDDLPQEVQEISLGEMFEADKSPNEMRARMEEQLSLKPWAGMDSPAMKAVVDEVMAVLEPLIQSAKKDTAAEEGKEAKP
mmetsp:Transcript_45943/g.92714  ORF Transcript_45943/g.92714 Transcript_45943/m.92714 type:complete len:247 (+) Transcript_45943:110-850(+)